MPRDANPRLHEFARSMRQAPSDSEKKLWSILRDRRCGGFKFRRQHPVIGYVLDFYCAEAQLAVETDGDQHAEDRSKAYDEKRTADLKEAGIHVLRFWGWKVLKEPDSVGRTILREVMDRVRLLGKIEPDAR